jgi:hypothetical protein
MICLLSRTYSFTVLNSEKFNALTLLFPKMVNLFRPIHLTDIVTKIVQKYNNSIRTGIKDLDQFLFMEELSIIQKYLCFLKSFLRRLVHRNYILLMRVSIKYLSLLKRLNISIIICISNDLFSFENSTTKCEDLIGTINHSSKKENYLLLIRII